MEGRDTPTARILFGQLTFFEKLLDDHLYNFLYVAQSFLSGVPQVEAP